MMCVLFQIKNNNKTLHLSFNVKTYSYHWCNTHPNFNIIPIHVIYLQLQGEGYIYKYKTQIV